MKNTEKIFERNRAQKKNDPVNADVAMRAGNLAMARRIAKEIAKKNGTVYADQVQEELAKLDIDLGNSAGSIFRGNQWVFAGKFVTSTRLSNHGRIQRLWRLR